MSTFTAITNSQIDAESYIDTVLAAQWRDNLLAIQEGDASASGVRIQAGAYETGSIVGTDMATGTVDQTRIGANAVGQSELKMTSEVNSVSGATGTLEFTSVGADYTMGWDGYVTGGATISLPQMRSNEASYTPEWLLTVSGGTGTGYARLWYVNSSPPYDLGDGEIPLFIEVELDPAGNIVAIKSAPEAAWHYNGPTNIKPCRYEEDGRAYRKIKDMSGIPLSLSLAMQAGDNTALDEYVAAFKAAQWIEQELTQEIKNADMNIIPLGIKRTRPENTIVMLDPVSDLTWELFEMRQHRQFNENEFIEKWCTIDTKPLPRNGPAGVDIVGFKKRNTRR